MLSQINRNHVPYGDVTGVNINITLFSELARDLPVIRSDLWEARTMFWNDRKRTQLNEIAGLLHGNDLHGLFGGRTFTRCKSGKSAHLLRSLYELMPTSLRCEFLSPSSANPMSGLNQKRPRLRLEPVAYAELGKQVLERDSWRCQNCGTADNLQVHHRNWRSPMGHDCLENLITLCVSCH